MVPPPLSLTSIPWHRRLEARVLLSATIIAALSMAAVILATTQVVSRYSRARSANDLQATRDAFDRLVDTRAQYALRETRLVAELPVFRAHLTDSALKTDEPTISDMADDYRQKLQAVFCIVTDGAGKRLGHAGPLAAPDGAGPAGAGITAAKTGQSSAEIGTIGRQLFLVVSVPMLFGEEVLGTLTVGYALDDRVASELALVARSEVNFVCDRLLCGSSLRAHEREALVSALQEDPEPYQDLRTTPVLRTIGDGSFLATAYGLKPPASMRGAAATPAPEAARLLLLQDWSPTEQALQQIYLVLAGVGLLAFVVSVGSMLVFSHRTAGPIRQLATTANEIASGNWMRPVPVCGPAEARTMAEAFNHMTLTLRHWYEQTKSQAQQLHESNERFRSVTDSVNDAIVSVTHKSEIMFWNLRAEQVFGYTAAEMIGQSISRLVPGAHRAAFLEHAERLASGDDRWLGQTFEIDATRRDGTEVPIELSLSTWRSAEQVFYTGVIRDISERKRAAEALHHQEELFRQAQKMEAVGRLAGGIAHDFNNLLTAILGYTDMLLDELAPDEPMRTDLEGIRKAGQSAASLTRELLAFSRKQVLQPVALDLNHVVRHTEQLLRRLVGEDVELVLTLDAAPATVKADKSQIEQVLLNLVVNARDAMPTGGRLTIATRAMAFEGTVGGQPVTGPPGQHVVITVQDTGHGMSEQIRSHIFEPFFTTKELGKGTGLGLATVYGIVKQSGGYIWVESEIDQGTAFHVSLPTVEAEPLFESEVAGDDDLSALGSELVLLVEDSDSVREMAHEVLTRCGYQVLEATNGEEALEKATPELDRIAIVLTDVVMPLMGGPEMATRLAALRPELKFIFTSGYTSDVVFAQVASCEGTTFLQKPFTPAQLTQAVRDALDAPVLRVL